MLLQANYANHIRLIVICPNYYPQRSLLLGFLQDTKSAYLRLDDSTLTKANILTQVAANLGTNSPHDVSYLVLDECDRVSPPVLDDTLLDLLQIMPSARIVVFSRQFPHIVLNNPQIRAITQIIPMRDEGDVTGKALPKLEVYALGQGRVYVDGKEITQWNGQLARNLFFYMIDNPIITRDVIFQTFWAGMPTTEATNVFHVTKRSIHHTLGFELITFSGPYYRLKEDVDLYYDVTNFYDKSELGTHERDISLLMETYQLFKYPFLQGTTMQWVETRREELEVQYSEAMNVLADLRMKAGDLDAALGLNIRILSSNRRREDLATRIMQLYMQRNQPCDALKIYHQTTQFLQKTLRLKPDEPLKTAGEEARLLCEQQSME